MKFLRVKIFKLALMLLLANVASPAMAACSSPQLPTTFTLPAVGILSNLPLGQAIPGAVINPSITITCNNTFPAGSIWDFTGPTATATAYPNVYTGSGLPSGIGVRINDENGNPVTPRGTNFPVGSAPNTVKTLNFSVELIKLSDTIAQTTTTASWNISVSGQAYANSSITPSTVKLAITILRPSIPTCSPSLSVTQVTLPTVSVNSFSGINSTAGNKPFAIALNCEANAAPQITFSDSTQPANATSLISLTSGSTATGIALQILSNGSPVMLSPGGQAMSGSTVVAPSPASSAQTVSVPLAAQYIQSAAQIGAGSVNGIATFSLTYQ